MWPVSWSAEEGAGIDDLLVGFGVGKSKPGVASESAVAGEANPSGVEACNVANRSGVEVAMGRLQLINKRTRKIVETSLSLLIIQFD